MKTILFTLLGLCFLSSDWLNAQERIFQFEFSHTEGHPFDGREAAVAIHSISFTNQMGLPLTEFELGNLEANVRQDTGWYRNEIEAGLGSFQWTGRNGLTASIRLPVPSEAEGIILTAKSIQDSIWMDIAMDGQNIGTRMVGDYWHSLYLPIKSTDLMSLPNAEPTWIPERDFPVFPQGDILYGFRHRTPLAFDQNASDVNWRVNQSFEVMMGLTLVSMQGLINRRGSRIYIEWYDPPAFEGDNPFEVARIWRELAEEAPGFDAFFHFDGLSSIHFLYRRFAHHFDGAVVYDPDITETINLATMIAGIENRVLLSPEQLDMPGMPTFSDVLDLRDLVNDQGWDNSNASRVAIYQWVYENLWGQLNKHQVGVVSPGPPSYQPYQGNDFWKMNLVERDFLIATKTSALWLSPLVDPDTTLFDLFISEANQPALVTGVMWGHEHETIDFVAKRGAYVSGHTWPESYTDANLSFWGSFPNTEPYEAEIRPEAIWATFSDGPMVMLHCTDGDALNYQMQKGYTTLLWDQSHQQYFGWTMNPTLYDMAPPIWEYYNESRTSASLIGGVSGVGYSYPTRMNDDQLGKFLLNTQNYFERTGLRTVHILSHGLSDSWLPQQLRIGQAYYDSLHQVGYLGMISPPVVGDWNMHFHYPDRPAPMGWTGVHGNLSSSNMDAIVQDLLATDSPDVIHVNSTEIGHGLEIVPDAEAFSGSASFIPASHPSGSILGVSQMNLPPGDYQFTVRLKVEDNSGSQVFTNFFVFDLESGLPYFNLELAGSDFNEANQYQSFTVSFTLDRYTSEFSVGMFHNPPQQNMYFDYFRVERTESSTLPHYSSILIDNFGLGVFGLNRRITELGIELARHGGAVISPEEWFASLNPEYMLPFAQEYLSAGHPALMQAQSQLNDGKYMGALITLRRALIENAPMNIFLTGNSPLLCYGDESGVLIANVVGGVAPYSYSWNTSSVNSNIVEGVAAGTYTVTVTDALGNSQTASYTLEEPAPLSGNIDIFVPDGCGGFKGQVIGSVSGGNDDSYHFVWDGEFVLLQDNESMGNRFQLAEGGHQLIVGDWRGCSDTVNFVVPAAPPLNVLINSLPDTAQTNVGQIWTEVTGGVLPYSYFWNTNPESRADSLFQLSSGDYSLTVMDALGCNSEVMGTIDLITKLDGVDRSAVLEIFPNPSGGIVNLRLSNNDLMVNLRLSTVDGTIIHQQKGVILNQIPFELDYHSLESGMYILTVQAEHLLQSHKIVLFK